MTIEEKKEQIAKLEKLLPSDKVPENLKESARAAIKQLKKEISDAETPAPKKNSASNRGEAPEPDYSKMVGLVFEYHMMGVREPQYARIGKVRVAEPHFTHRDVLIWDDSKFEAYSKFPLSDLPGFLSGEEVVISGLPGQKEAYAIKLSKESVKQARGILPKPRPKKKASLGADGEEIREGELAYNKQTKTLGIVRDVFRDGHGDVRTDADGVVAADVLERYEPKKHKRVKVAPITVRETVNKGLAVIPGKMTRVQAAKAANNIAIKAMGALSGSEVRSSKEKLERYASEVEKKLREASIKKASFTEKDYDELTDENYHLMNEFLCWNGYFRSSVSEKLRPMYAAHFERSSEGGKTSDAYANPDYINVSGAAKADHKKSKGETLLEQIKNDPALKEFDFSATHYVPDSKRRALPRGRRPRARARGAEPPRRAQAVPELQRARAARDRARRRDRALRRRRASEARAARRVWRARLPRRRVRVRGVRRRDRHAGVPAVRRARSAPPAPVV